MKTLQALYEEIMTNGKPKQEFMQAMNDDKAVAFLNAHDCNATPDEVKKFLEEKGYNDIALSDKELDDIAGGKVFSLAP